MTIPATQPAAPPIHESTPSDAGEGDDATPLALAGLRVVELGDGVAGSVASLTLAALGADVSKIVSGRRSVAHNGPRIVTPSGVTRSALGLTLDAGKTLVAGSKAPDLLESADLVIEDLCGPQVAGPRRTGAPVHVLISPFGDDGPYAGRPGGERTIQAASGLLGTISATSTDDPVPAPGFLAQRVAGHVAALAALHGLDRYRADGAPVTVDVSAQEAVAFTCVLPEFAHALFNCPGRAGSGRYLAPSGIFQCRDGWIRIAAIEDHQWRGLVSCLGSPTWTEGLEGREARIEHASLITGNVTEWTETHYKASCADQLQRAGVPATPVNGPDELLASPQFEYRHAFVDIEADGTALRRPGPPWTARSGVRHLDVPQGVAGLRVVELTHVLAGPIIGELLGAMGARVVRLEDLDRLDIYRRHGPFADGIQGHERGAYFAVANHSKDSVALQGAELVRGARQLIDESDVVIENVGEARLTRLGIDPDALAQSRGVLTARVSGFGTAGPLAGYRVYANNVQAYGGLALATIGPDGLPARFASVLADPLSSVVAATVVAAWAVGPLAGCGGCIDLSMAEVVMGLLSEQVLAASAHAPREVGTYEHGLRGVYQCGDGRWIALDVRTPDEWTQLISVLDPTHGSLPSMASGGIIGDDIVAEAIGRKGLAEVVALLEAEGLPVFPVTHVTELTEDVHLRSRGFFPRVGHADPELGDICLVGMPWRFAGEGPLPISPPPRLGGANETYGFSEGAKDD